MFGSIVRFVGGALVGGAVGAMAATLLAPKSGDELANAVRAYWQQVKDAGIQAELARRSELEARFKNAKLSRPVELDVDFYPREMRVESKVRAGSPGQDGVDSGAKS